MKSFVARNMHRCVIVVLALCFCAASSTVRAQFFSLEEDEILYVGQVKIFSADKLKRVAIGNPLIADIGNISDDAVSVQGQSAGNTTLLFWDELGEHSYQIRVLTADMTGAKRRIDALLEDLKFKGVTTKANDEEGKVLLLGSVQKPEDKDLIDLALGEDLQLKTIDLIQVEDRGVVEIEVQVLELDRDATKTLGFSWPGRIRLAEAAVPVFDAGTAGLIDIFQVTDFTRDLYALTLDFLVQEGKARILSRPRLRCSSGKEAEMLIGGEKPTFATAVQSGGSSSTTIEYKEYGIKLNIRPTIEDKKKIHLALGVEVSEVGDALTLGNPLAPTARAYPLTRRDIATELYLDDGQTMAIGGLIKQKEEHDIQKTAGLGDIPIIGALFRKKETKIGGGQGERGDIELFVTLTPSIVAQSFEVVAEEAEETDDFVFVDTEALINGYVKQVQARIVEATFYPSDAAELGWEGVVTVSLILDSLGTLHNAKVLQSSGHAVLDAAALEAVSKQAPYPSFPYQLDFNELQVDIPIAYRKDSL
ncbi:TonB family protein [Candidatus Omnitrophota bacterium]